MCKLLERFPSEILIKLKFQQWDNSLPVKNQEEQRLFENFSVACGNNLHQN